MASVARSSEWQAVPGVTLRTRSAEDLVIHEVFAGRTQDWADVEKVLQRQGRGLNLALIEADPAPLLALKGSPESLERFRGLARRHAR